MTGAGAMVAIIAAAQAQRAQEVTDAFRVAGATAPERARSLAALGLRHEAAVDELARAGVLVAGPARDSWWLDEAAVVARRRATGKATGRQLLVLFLVVAASLVALATLMLSRRG